MRKSLVFIILLMIAGCNPQRNTQDNESEDTNREAKADSSDVIEIDNFEVVPKRTFAFNSVLESYDDTLKLVTCGEYVFSPFGPLKNKSDLAKSNLKNFNIVDRVDQMDIGEIEFQILKLKSSKLILFFDNDPEASRQSYIFKGEIYDQEVNLADEIKIGMTKQAFINTYFDQFPDQLLEKYEIIIFESCVNDITHTYSFNNDVLESITFKTDSYWTVDY
jgi:hypothetical protein